MNKIYKLTIAETTAFYTTSEEEVRALMLKEIEKVSKLTCNDGTPIIVDYQENSFGDIWVEARDVIDNETVLFFGMSFKEIPLNTDLRD